jgi:DNA-binding NarL/FixJ family response regulator
MIIAEDHALVREGISRILDQDYEIVATVGDGRELVSIAEELKPDVILLDVSMPSLNGIEATRRIRQLDAKVKIIVVTMHTSAEYVREAFEAGASAYVLKQAAGSELSTAIQDAFRGRYFISPLAAKHIPGLSRGTEQNDPKLFRSLTPRQREVLQLIAEGKSAKMIAGQLNISTKTVEFHKKQIMNELNMRSTAELVRYAISNGWV